MHLTVTSTTVFPQLVTEQLCQGISVQLLGCLMIPDAKGFQLLFSTIRCCTVISRPDHEFTTGSAGV